MLFGARAITAWPWRHDMDARCSYKASRVLAYISFIIKATRFSNSRADILLTMRTLRASVLTALLNILTPDNFSNRVERLFTFESSMFNQLLLPGRGLASDQHRLAAVWFDRVPFFIQSLNQYKYLVYLLKQYTKTKCNSLFHYVNSMCVTVVSLFWFIRREKES